MKILYESLTFALEIDLYFQIKVFYAMKQKKCRVKLLLICVLCVLCKGARFFLSAKQHLGVLSFWGQESGSRTQGGHFSLATITLAADKPNVLINALTSI